MFKIFLILKLSLGFMYKYLLQLKTLYTFFQGFSSLSLSSIFCPKITYGEITNLFSSFRSLGYTANFFASSSDIILWGTYLIEIFELFIFSSSGIITRWSEREAVSSINYISWLMRASTIDYDDLAKFYVKLGMTWSSTLGFLWPMILIYYVRNDL